MTPTQLLVLHSALTLLLQSSVSFSSLRSLTTLTSYWKHFDDCRDESYGTSLESFGKRFYEKHGREPVCAVDFYLSFYRFQEAVKTKNVGRSAHDIMRTMRANMMNFISNFLEAGIKVVLVVDGEYKPSVKRLRHMSKYTTVKLEETRYRDFTREMNIPVVHAPGEGEAQCAHMQRYGLADFAYSFDSDVIIFGARRILRKLIRPKDAPRNALSRYFVYDIPDNHKWASPATLLCYAMVRGGDYHKGGVNMLDVAAEKICQTADWAEKLYAISTSDERAVMKQTLLLQWRKELQAEISKGGYLSINRSAVLNNPELKDIHAYLTPRIHHEYDFASVPEIRFNLEFFKADEWFVEDDRTCMMTLRLARIGLTYHLKNLEDPELFTFKNEMNTSCDKEVYKIKYCPFYINQYPRHVCDDCPRKDSTVSASMLMQSKYDHKQRYVDMVAAKKGKPKGKKTTKQPQPTRQALSTVDVNRASLSRAPSKRKFAGSSGAAAKKSSTGMSTSSIVYDFRDLDDSDESDFTPKMMMPTIITPKRNTAKTITPMTSGYSIEDSIVLSD